MPLFKFLNTPIASPLLTTITTSPCVLSIRREDYAILCALSDVLKAVDTHTSQSTGSAQSLLGG